MTHARGLAEPWTRAPFDEDTQRTVSTWIEENNPLLEDAFAGNLSFGTGGLRGITGPGTNRINRYTVGLATQGLAHYLQKRYPGERLRVALAYDSRLQSEDLANDVTRVLTANGLEVYRFTEPRPTPELSFAIRHHGCHSGIVITASHNPPEYNGYKVYGADGGQLVPPHDQAVIHEAGALEFADIRWNHQPELVTLLGEETDEAFIQAGLPFALNSAPKDLSIVYSPLHGTTGMIFPKAFEAWGFRHAQPVPEQFKPDGHFPTVQSPNPEEPEALTFAIRQAEASDADLVLATDPDGDRVGVAVRNEAGQFELLNGNAFAVVLTDYLLSRMKNQGTLPANGSLARTIVTTPLLDNVGRDYGVETLTCLTGFKWIAELIATHEGQKSFICGGEESFGFMVGDFVRDKDAITAALVVADAAENAAKSGKTLLTRLKEIHARHGLHREKLISRTMKGLDGMERIAGIMEEWRNNPPQELLGERIVERHDYQSGTIETPAGVKPTGMPKSNVIQWVTEAGTRVTARPSGTEPKIKFYLAVQQRIEPSSTWERTNEALSQKLAALEQALPLPSA